MDRGRLRLTLGLDGDDRSVETVLEEQGRKRVLLGEVDDLVPDADELAALDLTDRPNAALLVARVLQRRVRSLDRAQALAAGAHTAFAEEGDIEGMGAAQVVLGDLAWQRGQIAEADAHWAAAMEHQAAGPASAGLLTLRAAADFLTLGDVDRSMPRVHEAYAATMLAGSEVDEAMATLLGGLLLIDTGDLERAGDALRRADDLFSEAGPDGDVGMWPLVAIGLGEIAIHRGDHREARAQYARGLDQAERLGRPAVALAARAMVPLHLSDEDPAAALAAARATVADAAALDAHWFARQLAERALTEAERANHQLEAATVRAGSCVEGAANPLLRAKCRMLQARVALDARDRALAVAALDEAATTFLSRGTYLWAVAALVTLASADPARANELLGLAYDRTGPDIAFQRLWNRRPPVVVTVGPGAHCRVRLGDEELRLGDKGGQLLAEVVRSGAAGLHWEQAAHALWPDDTNHDRIKSRLTSLTSLVRGRLQTEGWRLRREGPLFVFIPFAAEVRTDASA